MAGLFAAWTVKAWHGIAGVDGHGPKGLGETRQGIAGMAWQGTTGIG